MNEAVAQANNRNRHYGVELQRYYRMPAVQASLTTVLSLFIVAFFVIVAIRPTLVTVATLKKSIESSEKTLKQLQAKERAVQQAAMVWEQLQSDLPFVNKAVPVTGAEYDVFTKSLEMLAVQSGVTLSSVTVGESLLYSEILKPYEGRGRTVVMTPLTIRVSGSYPDIRSFFSLLTNIDRLVDIDTLSVGRDSGGKGADTNVALSLTGSVSYLADEDVLNNILVKKDEK